MGKTLFYRLFGVGKVPKRVLPDIEREVIILLEEGIGGSLTFKKYRAPGRYYYWRRNWFTGSLVLTEKRFWAFTLFKPVISVPWDDEKLKELRCSVENEKTLCVVFDASVFQQGCSGTIECRFSTPKARLFLERLHTKGCRPSG